jgi:VWFA-related protein
MRILKYVFQLGVLAIVLSPVAYSQAPDSTAPPNSSTGTKNSTAGVVVTMAGMNSDPTAPPTIKDFSVKDEGRPVSVAQLRSMKDEPLIFSLLLDTSGSTGDVAPEQIRAAIRLFTALSSSKNKGYLVIFHYEVFPSDSVLDVTAAEKILTRRMDRAGATAAYDALVHSATKQLATAKYPFQTRRAIFLFSDGGDNSSHTTLEQTLAIVQREGVQIFPIVLPPNERSIREAKREAKILATLTKGTGGQIIEADQEGRFVSRILQILGSQYELDFIPAATKPHKLHSLEIKPATAGTEVLAPSKYFAP